MAGADGMIVGARHHTAQQTYSRVSRRARLGATTPEPRETP